MEQFKFYAFKLTGIIIVVFILQQMIRGFTGLFVLNGNVWSGEIWRFFTSIFLHGGLGHLAYNMFALLLFGSIVEKFIGSKGFLLVFLITGIFASLISVNFYSSALGASGAIFGIIGALVILRPGMAVWAFGMPMPMFLAATFWTIGDVIGVFVPSNVANLAHLSGMVLGIAFGIYYRNWSVKRKNPGITISDRDIKRWEESYLN